MKVSTPSESFSFFYPDCVGGLLSERVAERDREKERERD